MGIFDHIDFNNILGWNEVNVCEEIITPFIKLLGYSPNDGPNRFLRELPVPHNLTRFGTKSERARVIPDYLVQVNGKNAFVLEAKAPSENIKTGKHVAQAYSYATNIEIKIKRFVLCNGREFIILDTDKEDPLVYFCLGNATEDDWGKVYQFLSPAAFINPHIFDYKPDYGI